MNLIDPWVSFLKNKRLIIELTKHQLSERSNGSFFGVAWFFIYPALMLTVYSFVFTKIFKIKWHGAAGSDEVGVTLIIFTGMLTATFFAESLSNASGSIRNNVSYVKKIIFPIDVLPLVSVMVACVQAAASIAILIVALMAYGIYPSWSILLVPLVMIIYVILLIGLAQIVASVGVYIPDISQTVNVLAVALSLLSPEFYPLSMVPDKYHWLIELNPLTLIMEWLRHLLITNDFELTISFGIYAIVALSLYYLGYALLNKLKAGFADVI